MPDETVEPGARRRWRRWSVSDKLRIVAESEASGSGVNIVAARYEVRASLVSTWRRQFRNGSLRSSDTVDFVPVRLAAAAEPSARLRPAATSEADAGCIAIVLPDGTRLDISHAAPLPLLHGVLTALRG